MFGSLSSDLVIVDGNARSVRPTAAGSNGTSVAPGASNAKGSYTQLIASSAEDAHAIMVVFNADPGASRSKLMDISIGAAASEAVLLPDLICGPAATLYANALGGGIPYLFPVFIPAGTRLACRGQVNNATAGTVTVLVRLFKARQPHSFRCGSRVVAYGIDSANSRGTVITEATTSESNSDYAELGTIAAGDYPWWWELGVGVDAASLTARQHNADLAIGDATNKRTVVEDRLLYGTTTPAYASFESGAYSQAVPGEKVYGRQQSSGAAEATTWYHTAYGVI